MDLLFFGLAFLVCCFLCLRWLNWTSIVTSFSLARCFVTSFVSVQMFDIRSTWEYGILFFKDGGCADLECKYKTGFINFQRIWSWGMKNCKLFKTIWIIFKFSWFGHKLQLRRQIVLDRKLWAHLLVLNYRSTKFSYRFFFKYKVLNYYLASVNIPNLV